jgi:hypothetical protein
MLSFRQRWLLLLRAVRKSISRVPSVLTSRDVASHISRGKNLYKMYTEISELHEQAVGQKPELVASAYGADVVPFGLPS